MGTPTQTQIQNMTDMEAAEIEDWLDGYLGVALGKASSTMADYLQDGGDADLLIRLLSPALERDEHSLPENAEAALQALAGRAKTGTWMRALRDAVMAEGGHASFDAYLTARSATVQALWAEAFGYAGGSALSAANVLAPLYAARTADRVYTGTDGGGLVDDTTDAASAAAADVAVFADDDFCLYVGSRWKFNRLVVGLSTLASATVVPTFQYFNGTAWATLTATDNSAGFTLNRAITWTAPTDWEPARADGGGTAFADKSRLYYVRVQRTAADPLGGGDVNPVASMIHVCPTAVNNASAAHLGVRQGPLGLAEITADNTISAESLNAVAHARWIPPAIQLRALNALGADATITVSYVDQDGNDNTQAQTNWVSPAANATKAVTLNGADTGARSVRTAGWAVTSTGRGVIAVESVLTRTPAI